MSRLTPKERDNDKCWKNKVPLSKALDKLAHYEDLEEQGDLLTTHQAAAVLAETFGYNCPCNFNGIDEWFPYVCDLAEFCPDGKIAVIACWEQYIKVKLAELKEGGGDE